MTTPIPKEQAQADIAVFEHYIAELHPDPHCKVGGCFGRGYLGFQVVPTKDGPRTQLLTCKCSRPGKAPYTLLKEQLDRGLGFVHATLKLEIEANRRRTFFGGLGFAFSWVWGKIRRKKS